MHEAAAGLGDHRAGLQGRGSSLVGGQTAAGGHQVAVALGVRQRLGEGVVEAGTTLPGLWGELVLGL